jgi:hypothetical protein
VSNDKELATTGSAGQAVKNIQVLAEQIGMLSGGVVEQQDGMLLASMFQSGYFKDIDSLTKAVVRAAFGKRIGVDVMTAVTSLYIIDGKPALEAQAIRNTCVMAGYDIVTKELSNERCVLEWHFKGKKLGESEFTKVDAMRMGFIDATCTNWPEEHNVREIRYWNKWKKPVAGYDSKQGCECKDNWIKVPKPMLMARATTLGSRMYGNHALKQEVYDLEELQDSNIRPDTTAVDAYRMRIDKAESIDEVQTIVGELSPEDLSTLLEDINVKTKELLNESNPSRSSAEK